MKWTEPWYSAYAIVGMMVLGVAPILIPLTVENGGKNGATAVGLVVAAFYAGGLLAPVLGSLADTRGWQRRVFLWLFPVMAATTAAFAFVDAVWLWAALAFVFGGSGSLSGTVAGLFVVESKPQAEWNERLSWFRLFYGAGQVIGLLIAAITASMLQAGWLVTALILALGFFLGRLKLPKLTPTGHSARQTVPSAATAQPPAPTPATAQSNTRLYFTFLAMWLFAMTGVQTLFNVVPLVMRDAFHVNATISSILFLVGAAIGTLLYPVASQLANRFGPGLVFLLGLSGTLLAFVAMALATWFDLPAKSIIGSAALVLAAISYTFEVASATMMIVRLTPGSEGSAMGLLNGIIAGGAVIGAIVPSFLAEAFGYPSLPGFAIIPAVIAVLVGVPLYRRKLWLTQESEKS